MRDAGRIGFDIKGSYDSEMKYEFLDVVYYQNSSYVAKKETIGNAPADNNEFWQILARGESSGGDADGSDMTVKFEQAATMTNISTGEKLSSLFGKIKKWYTDLPGTHVMGYIQTLTDFNQLNNTYRYWKISNIDSAYASEIGIDQNVGDFYALILGYNGDGTDFNFGNIILSSPRLNNDYYLVQMWRKVPHVTYHRANVPSLTNNLLATVPGQSALDAAQGKVLSDRIDQLNSDLSSAKSIRLVTQYISTLSTDETGNIYYDFVTSEDLPQYASPIVQNSYNNNQVIGTKNVDKNTIRIYFSCNVAPLTVSILYKIKL